MILDQPTREQSKKHLDIILANTMALAIQTHGAHWNVEGASFAMIHTFLEEHYDELYEAVDEIAERIRFIGFYALPDIYAFAEQSTLVKYPAKSNINDLLSDLLDSHMILEKQLRAAIQVISDGSDEGTTDFLVGRLQAHEKMMWMLSSHLK